jgi:DNA invertase Pin-like site-specific DNA recombinase
VPLIGYARISTEDQTALPQVQELRSAGCAEIVEAQASGGGRTRPILARALDQLRVGDTLVVVRIDRLARSLSHFVEIIERLEAKGAHFRSLQDPIDTASPQGKFTLQVLGAAAEFERALIRERTKAGLRSAKAEGRVGGNPGLKTGDPVAIRKTRAARVERLIGASWSMRESVPAPPPRPLSRSDCSSSTPRRYLGRLAPTRDCMAPSP